MIYSQIPLRKELNKHTEARRLVGVGNESGSNLYCALPALINRQTDTEEFWLIFQRFRALTGDGALDDRRGASGLA